MLTHRDTHMLKCSLAKSNTLWREVSGLQCPGIMMKLHRNNLQHLHRGHCCGANASLPLTYRHTPLPQCILGVWVTKGTKKLFS